MHRDHSGPVLRLGIAGLGSAGSTLLAAALRHPGFKVTAAADIRKEARDKFAGEVSAEVYERVEDLCASPHIDAIHIATAHQFHATHAVAAAEHGKHIVLGHLLESGESGSETECAASPCLIWVHGLLTARRHDGRWG